MPRATACRAAAPAQPDHSSQQTVSGLLDSCPGVAVSPGASYGLSTHPPAEDTLPTPRRDVAEDDLAGSGRRAKERRCSDWSIL